MPGTIIEILRCSENFWKILGILANANDFLDNFLKFGENVRIEIKSYGLHCSVANLGKIHEFPEELQNSYSQHR